MVLNAFVCPSTIAHEEGRRSHPFLSLIRRVIHQRDISPLPSFLPPLNQLLPVVCMKVRPSAVSNNSYHIVSLILMYCIYCIVVSCVSRKMKNLDNQKCDSISHQNFPHRPKLSTTTHESNRYNNSLSDWLMKFLGEFQARLIRFGREKCTTRKKSLLDRNMSEVFIFPLTSKFPFEDVL